MNINSILQKDIKTLTAEEQRLVVNELISAMKKEEQGKYRQGIYAKTQKSMAYNSNKIEGSTLTPDQTETLFDTGTLISDSMVTYRAKDIEEMNGHFKMFNIMLNTLDEPLTEDLIKKYHYALKAGVFEDFANGYPVGEYKNRLNTVNGIDTAHPLDVKRQMAALLEEYSGKEKKGLHELAEFHAKYEKIHPFQDGNGRTGRMILFRQCLDNGLVPVIIEDKDKEAYKFALKKAQTENDYSMLYGYFEKAQEQYYKTTRDFLYDYSRNLCGQPLSERFAEAKTEAAVSGSGNRREQEKTDKNIEI